MKTDLLFVYGLLRTKANHEVGQYLTKNATFVAEATFQGKLYRVSYYPGVVPSSHKQDQVLGDVFKIPQANVLTELDYFEGVDPHSPAAENEYIRKIQEVLTVQGEKLLCWIYLYNWQVDEKDRIKSGDFLETLRH